MCMYVCMSMRTRIRKDFSGNSLFFFQGDDNRKILTTVHPQNTGGGTL